MFDINSNWLLTQEGEIFNEKPIRPTELPEVDNAKFKGGTIIIEIPFVPIEAHAGFIQFCDSLPEISKLETKKIEIVPGEFPRNAVSFEIQGDSMEPRMRQGDTVFCVEIPTEEWRYVRSDQTYVLVAVDMITVKNLRILDESAFTCLSSNPVRAPFVVPFERIKRLYIVKKFQGKP